MKAVALFEEFLNRCKEYEDQYDRVIVKNGKNILSLLKPSNSKQQDFVIYEFMTEDGREQGSASDIDELIEVVISIVGEDKIKSDEKNKDNSYGYYM